MIVGIGTDLIEIERIKKAVDKSEHFLTRYFTDKEIAYFNSKKNNYESIAANFAVKEAVSKAIGTGFRNFSLKDIEVLRDDLGKPYVNLYNRANEIISKLNMTTLHVSISHSRTNAIAFVVIERG